MTNLAQAYMAGCCRKENIFTLVLTSSQAVDGTGPKNKFDSFKEVNQNNGAIVSPPFFSEGQQN